METHLRQYFSSSSVQLEVDASLFGRALENNDPQLAKKVFGELAMSPSSRVVHGPSSLSLRLVSCLHWLLLSQVHDALPPDYLVRVWDVSLFEEEVLTLDLHMRGSSGVHSLSAPNYRNTCMVVLPHRYAGRSRVVQSDLSPVSTISQPVLMCTHACRM